MKPSLDPAAIVCIISSLSLTLSALGQGEWPQFRGAQSSATNQKAHPPQMLEPKNRLWKTEIPRGHSSPVLWDDLIFVTAVEGSSLQTICLDSKSGKILWKKNAPTAALEKIHEVNSFASPTPACDGDNVFVYFGSYGVLAYNHQGSNGWQFPLPIPQSTWGTAASPVLYNGNLILVSDSNDKKSELFALDCKTGKTNWRVERKDFGSGWCTPYIWHHRATDELIVGSSSALVSYEPDGGKELWRISGLVRDPVAMPVGSDDLLFYVSPGIGTAENTVPSWADFAKKYDANGDGKVQKSELPADSGLILRPEIPVNTPGNVFRYSLLFGGLDRNKDGALDEQEWFGLTMFLIAQNNSIFAVKPGAHGTVLPEQIAWKAKKGLPELPSPLLFDNKIYLVKNGGMLTCYEAKDGKLVYDRERIEAEGQYCASPVVAGGVLYNCSEQGMVTVISTGPAPKVLGHYDMKEKIYATPAICNNTIYIRTDKSLMAFGE